MKKNLISVLILALVVVNLAMTAILMITILPQAQKSNELVQKVASAIDLELESGSTVSKPTVPIADIETYSLSDDMIINLKMGADNKQRSATVTVTLSLNKKADGYKKLQPQLTTKEDLIKTTINSVVSGYTYDEITGDQQQVEDAILGELQTMFDSDFIIEVGFSTATFS